MNSSDVRLIAFYLPQFHPIPENDEWWGKGFTEWRNVVNAVPRFSGHYQPHIPADLSFYDLRLPETREAQSALAREYGIHGFCYYHYWFNGRRLLERPFSEVLRSGKPDFPFCICWANENWTRAWDGMEKQVLIQQNYGDADDAAHIESLIPALADSRYIRIDGRPLLMVYRTELLPDPARTAGIWREIARAHGIGELYLARVESWIADVNPAEIGFDAAVEFAPAGRHSGECLGRGWVNWFLSAVGIRAKGYLENFVRRYDTLAVNMSSSLVPKYKRFRCVMPGWDNSARRAKDATIFVGSTPECYGKWLRSMVLQTMARYSGGERIVFVNAWNEWAEGNHLEPDLRWRRAYLDATRAALEGVAPRV